MNCVLSSFGFGVIAVLCFSGGTTASKVHYYPEWSPIKTQNEGQKQVQYFSAYQQNHGHHQLQSGQSPNRRQSVESTLIPRPRQDSDFHDKLGFGSLSSLLPTSILRQPESNPESGYGNDENSVETEGSNEDSGGGGVNPFSFLQAIRQSLRLNNDSENSENYDADSYQPSHSPSANQGGYDESSNEINGDSNTNEEQSENIGNGLLSKIKNSLPFRKGFLQGLLNNRENSSDSSSQNQGYSQSQGYEQSSQVAFDPSGINLTENQNDYEQSDYGTNDSSGILPKFPNPFKKLRNILGNIKLPSVGNEEVQEGYEGGSQNELPSITSDTNDPLSNLKPQLDIGAIAELQEVFSSLFAKVVTTYGLSKAKVIWLKVGLMIFGPIVGGAIAAMVIGIVYISIYVPAYAIQNEGVDGELTFIKFKQLLDILGLPDPFEELFDVPVFRGFSTGGRLAAWKKHKFLEGTSLENGMCIERLTCEIIGRRVMRRKSLSWLGTKIAKIADTIELKEKETNGRLISKSPWEKLGTIGKALLKAIAVGMKDDQMSYRALKDSDGRSETGENHGQCFKYACDPIQILRRTLHFGKQKLGLVNSSQEQNKS